MNRRTGEVEKVPEGIDPGWDTNPGAVGRPTQAARLRKQKEAASKKELARPVARRLEEQVKTRDAGFEAMTEERYDALWTGDTKNPEAKAAMIEYMNLFAAPGRNYGARARLADLTDADKAMERRVEAAARPLSRDVTTFRGLKGDHFATTKVGDEIDFGEVTSTSTANAWAMRFGTPDFQPDTPVDFLFVIRNQKGQSGLLAHYPEREITLPAGTRFRVTRIETDVKGVPAGLFSWAKNTQAVRRVVHLERLK